MDWATERLAINRKVRRVLVAHFIDLGRLAFNVYPDRVMLRGSLTRIEGAPGELTPDLVRAMFAEVMQSSSSINRVTTQFDNWRQEGARNWVPLHSGKHQDKQKKAAALLSHSSSKASQESSTHTLHAEEIMGADTSIASFFKG